MLRIIRNPLCHPALAGAPGAMVLNSKPLSSEQYRASQDHCAAYLPEVVLYRLSAWHWRIDIISRALRL